MKINGNKEIRRKTVIMTKTEIKFVYSAAEKIFKSATLIHVATSWVVA